MLKNRSFRQETPLFPIVGIGASAGGLEAIEQFLRHVPENSGAAFVIVQHLDPTHKGIMTELLQRITGMHVFQVRDRMKVEPNAVYLIPPNRDMSILHGVLYLFEPSAARGLRLPIDFFFSSLAEDRWEHSIGVILSGMGSDGTIGCRAIKEKAGLVLVQDPASSKFDSMPRSAINAGIADIVAPVEDLPGKIIDYLGHALVMTKDALHLEDKDHSSLSKVLVLLRAKTGHDFSMYKNNTLYRRIERRMGVHQISKIASYVRYLQENSQEVELLFKELLIGVTSFFRDEAAWEKLRKEVLPALLTGYPQGGALRAWSAGCSTGEEAYSLAMVFKEAAEKIKSAQNYTLQIFATDLDQDVIDYARQGIYPAGIAADVSSLRLKRFFIKEEKHYRVSKEIREMVTFATQNIIMDPPFTKMNIIICRNLLIYLTPELQKKLLPIFYYSLKPNGVLFLGSAETINNMTDLFAPFDIKSKLFRRRESTLAAEPLAFRASLVPAPPEVPKELTMLKPAINLQSLADHLLLQKFSPPAVLVNDKGDILYVSGRTGKYLEPAAGKANWNIFAMVREELRFDLDISFKKALRQKKAITARGLRISTGGGTQRVDITVQEIKEPEALQGMVMVVFTDVATPLEKTVKVSSRKGPVGNARVRELEKELHQFREQLQITQEEMQSSQEELKSTNEELQSTNEELQSTNEELTTSREEMQSMNEELQTVNAEQLSKMDELSRLNDDMRNLLNSTEIVTVFLDNDLHVLRFTHGADKLFKLIPGDVGRPLSDITSDLIYPQMTEDARDVLRTLAFSEKQIAATDGRWFSVRIMPYRTMEDVICGVVITFVNITAAKALEAELREEIEKMKTEVRRQNKKILYSVF
ncbi:MAG: PAS domain-containing protein [Syntrophaceae bacterium]|nr:PAS domain-containing protein [Syntrophaceae bacterium]